MTITLQKNQTISLSKERPGLSKVFMGLGWDPAKAKGFFGKLTQASSIDLDASAVVLDANKNELYSVSFSSLRSRDGAIVHDGDNLTGEGDGDDEVIHVDLAKLPADAAYVVFTVNSFRGQTFDEVDNAVARLVDDTNNQEIATFTLREQGRHTGVIMAVLSKGSDGWSMKAIGTPASGRRVSDMLSDIRAAI